MQVNVLSIYGENEALLGMGLSYGVTTGKTVEDIIYDKSLRKQLIERAKKLAGKGLGHDKFLRAITVYLDVEAPLYWWKQFDTYKVGTVTQSESTMHTVLKNPITLDMFESPADISLAHVAWLEEKRKDKDFDLVIKNMPDAFLQRRVICTNYEVLLNIHRQRHAHKLPEWKFFCEQITTHLSLWDNREDDERLIYKK